MYDVVAFDEQHIFSQYCSDPCVAAQASGRVNDRAINVLQNLRERM